MVILGLFAAAWVVSLSGALMPGPLFTVTINESLHRSVLAGPLVVAGHALLELLLVIALLLGLQEILTIPQVEFWLSLAGAMVLGYLALGLLQATVRSPVSLPSGQGGTARGGQAKQWLKPVWSGIITSAVNPYWELWWATIGAAMLFQARVAAGGPGVMAFYTGHILGDLSWYTAVSLAVVSGRRWLSQAAYRWLTGGCGVFLFALAVYFFYHAIGVGGKAFFLEFFGCSTTICIFTP